MTYEVRIQANDKRFTVQDNETLLQAGLRQGLGLPYGCKDGACGSCRARIVEGSVALGMYQQKALPDADRAQGITLLCCARPTTDIVLDVRVVGGAGEQPVRKLPCRVNELEQLADDVMRVKLQLPATEKFVFQAGQYIDLLLKDGKRRSYSMGNAPHQEGPIELHIRHMPGGVFTDSLFGGNDADGNAKPPTVKVRDILRLEGPLGTFFLREEDPRPVVMLASGTGFAPIKAIIEHIIAKGWTRPISLYWGGRRPKDLYLNALAQSWAQVLPDFKYIPVISDALPDDNWAGRTGFVHQAVMQDLPDLSGHTVYACGAPIVIESARRDFAAQCGLPEDAFFADSFTSEADKQGA